MEDKEKLQINNYKLQIVDLYKLFITRIKSVELKTWIKRLGFYIKIWWMMSKNAFMMYFNQKSILAIFLAGKIFRFTFFIIFLYFLVSGSKGLAGYNTNQIIFFFLSFNVIDITSQFLFREVYRFRTLVVSGDLDLILTKPINPLFRILFGGADVIDLITIPPVVAATIYMGAKLGPSAVSVFLYILLIINSLLISTAFHILVVSMAIITLEIDHTVMIFRDLSRLGTVPIDVFKQPLRGFITYVVPIGIMLSFPAKAFLGLLDWNSVIVSFVFGITSIFMTLRFWNFAIKKYTSASS
ncbi:MAG: hypothetical protein US62_C0007G0003 [Candidatus Woesebacteria bacterium GW2011_GWA1_37_8]|uniref:Uncharacterized protein n=2 Tax=Candidatus Woeseibacteriota TaxID=1752722 RepID=A0A0G0HRY9_9BACT|nr:MAG: hypothetical protein US39_C0001G0085 [Microgenomates group bacterium GW2011_GWC1_37_12b]KKQ45928.1 MAG: hypothetical protein US62_C0007G0003 [Candidatus Woesebacteria bacterium GW2011_GWA1_37_8]